MQTVKNILRVASGNIVTIISGVLISFFLPKMLSVGDYGLYKTFTLYSNYLGVLSFGIIDGIVLVYGGKDYNELERKTFRALFLWYSIITGFVAIILFSATFLTNSINFRFIIISISVYYIAFNYIGYFQQISQITQRFKEYSIIKILQAIINIISIAALYILFCRGKNISYTFYIIVFIITSYIVAIWYIDRYKDIVFGIHDTLNNNLNEIVFLAKKGFPLLFANLCSLLILSLDRQFVNVLFSTEEYAVYAFAYSMISLITVATAAISTVIYPMMKRMNIEALATQYCSIVGIMLVIVFGVCVSYFPLCILIDWFLPNYIESLVIFRIILPGIAVSSAITVVMHNYYKAIDEAFNYFVKSVVVLIVSALANYIAYQMLHTTKAISVASILTMLIWYVIADRFLLKRFKKDGKVNCVYMVCMIVVFYCLTASSRYVVSGLLYMAFFAVFTLLLQRKSVKNIFSLLRS